MTFCTSVTKNDQLQKYYKIGDSTKSHDSQIYPFTDHAATLKCDKLKSLRNIVLQEADTTCYEGGYFCLIHTSGAHEMYEKKTLSGGTYSSTPNIAPVT
jgi:hypothetical protein